MLRRRADERDAVIRAGTCEIRVFREKSVAGVDRVDLVLDGNFDQGGDVEIGLDRFPTLLRSNKVRFVGL